MNYDLINGQQVPQKEVLGDESIHGIHQGSVNVKGGQLTILGILQGSLRVSTGAKVVIIGKQQGSVNVQSGALVIVEGSLQGSSHVHSDGKIIVEPSGKLCGSLNNKGVVVVRGVFGGAKSGNGIFTLEGQGSIKQPRIADGVHIYDI